MNRPIGNPVRTAQQRLNEDIADLAADSTRLKTENAELRRKMAQATAQIAQLEALARAVKTGAATHPHWPLARWVRFGPMAALLATIKD